MAVGRTPVLLALGSNLGDKAANLRAALSRLAAFVDDIHMSQVFRTAPRYVTDQPAFLNMAARGLTGLEPRPLLRGLKELETSLGRQPSVRFGPRVIDLDILYYGDRIIDDPDLRIPHPRLRERGFVLLPLAEIAADWRDPRDQRTIADLLAALPDGGEGCEPAGPLNTS